MSLWVLIVEMYLHHLTQGVILWHWVLEQAMRTLNIIKVLCCKNNQIIQEIARSITMHNSNWHRMILLLMAFSSQIIINSHMLPMRLKYDEAKLADLKTFHWNNTHHSFRVVLRLNLILFDWPYIWPILHKMIYYRLYQYNYNNN